MRLQIAIWLGLGLYTLLSITDWLMTFALLRMSPDTFEANPFAAACLEQYGWNGLALYKAGGVLMFIGAVFLISRRRPAVATSVVALGCAVLLSVTIYSHNLICEFHRENQLLAETEWKPKQVDNHDLNGVKIPKQCWFAEKPYSDAVAMK